MQAFANQKYNILLEKPMSINVEECVKIHQAVIKNHVILAVCHVLRYTQYTKAIRRILDSKVLGDIVNIQHLEPVGFWHFAHSFVRGNWHNENASTFALLAKSCHDIDLVTYMMDSKCKVHCIIYAGFYVVSIFSLFDLDVADIIFRKFESFYQKE
jgi:predicted dehydrogenase